MSVRNDLGLISGDVVLETARCTGAEISLSHRGAAGVTLEAHVSSEKVEQIGVERNRAIQLRTRRFIIPVQTGFVKTTDDTEPIEERDQITYTNRRYVVTQVERKSAGNVYVVTAQHSHTLSMGA